MIRYLIKNNAKLMGRSWVNVLLFAFCPVIVSAVLISAFSSLMEGYKEHGEMRCGYSIEAGSPWEMAEEALKASGANADITFTEYEGDEPEELISNNDLSGFVKFDGKKYTIYRVSDQPTQGAALEYFMSIFCDEAMNASAAKAPVDGAPDAAAAGDPAAAPVDAAPVDAATATPAKDYSYEDVKLTIEHPSFLKPVDSTGYYGIVFVLYYSWCAIICASGLLTSEKKYGIRRRYVVSALSDTQLYLGKFLPLAVVVFFGTIGAAIINSICFGTSWGNLLYAAFLFLIMTAASSALGLMFQSITDNMIITVILTFSLVWIAGFFGGSFETYMFSSQPEYLKVLSPIYHCNRAMVEQASSGRTDYFPSAILYCAGIVVVCSLISVAANSIRRRGRA
ncbi:MAG: ABC transporter permease [Clostridiales bacterium]|nr:ABC transporter permease [Clostridiales bacterium]